MVNAAFPDSLIDARKRKLPWLNVARSFKDWEAGGVPADSLQSAIQIAEQKTGYSANQLRRMLAALSFLNELEDREPALRNTLGTPRFSHAEMLAKIWRTDPSALIGLLEKEPVLRYETLYQLHHDLQRRSAPAPMLAGKRASAALKERFIAIVRKSTNFLSLYAEGFYEILEPKLHHPYAKPTLLLCVRQSGTDTQSWVGIDFISTLSADDNSVHRRMVTLATEASFLDAQIVVVPKGDGFKSVARVVEDLNLKNFGIIVVHAEGADWQLHPTGAPEPDRRKLWQPPRAFNSLIRWTNVELDTPER